MSLSNEDYIYALRLAREERKLSEAERKLSEAERKEHKERKRRTDSWVLWHAKNSPWYKPPKQWEAATAYMELFCLIQETVSNSNTTYPVKMDMMNIIIVALSLSEELRKGPCPSCGVKDDCWTMDFLKDNPPPEICIRFRDADKILNALNKFSGKEEFKKLQAELSRQRKRAEAEAEAAKRRLQVNSDRKVAETLGQAEIRGYMKYQDVHNSCVGMQWACPSCTFINSGGNSCDICSTPRTHG